jgi:co-chaperonin GroES (HSP10)
MKNESGLKPLGRAVLVVPYEPQKKGSLIVMPDVVRSSQLAIETRAVVVEVGPEAWADEKVPRAKEGDKVFISKFAGVMAKGTADGKDYRLINDNDIFCAIEVDAND